MTLRIIDAVTGIARQDVGAILRIRCIYAMLIVYSLVYNLTQVPPLAGLVLLSGPTGLCLVAIPVWTAFAF